MFQKEGKLIRPLLNFLIYGLIST